MTKIIEETKLPAELTEKILQRLSKTGVLCASKGLHGGYLLTKDLQTIDFYYLSECLLVNRVVDPCEQGKKSCSKHPCCEMEEAMSIVDKKVKIFWSNFTVENVLNNRV